jgi:hypothetical protein
MSENALRAANFVEVGTALQDDVGTIVRQPDPTALPSSPSQKFILMTLVMAGLVLSLLWGVFLVACLAYLLLPLLF